MKKITKHATLLSIGTVMLCSALAAPAAAKIPAANRDECYFVTELKNPISRMEFVTRLELAKQTPDTLTGIPARGGDEFLVTMMDQDGRPAEIDQFSFDCMSCHDGMNASSHNIRVRNSRSGSNGGFSSVTASHPIGMDYGSCASGSQSFRSAEGLIFVAGRVGCLSCHNPLNPERFHLAVNNDGSALCFTCHNT